MSDTTSSLQQFLGKTTVYHVPDTTKTDPSVVNRQMQSSQSYQHTKHHHRSASKMDDLVKFLSVGGKKTTEHQNYTSPFTPTNIRSIPMPPLNNKVPTKHRIIENDKSENLRKMLESDNLDEPYIERASRPSSSAHMGIASFISNDQHARENNSKKLSLPESTTCNIIITPAILSESKNETSTNDVVIANDNVTVSEKLNVTSDNISIKSNKSRDAFRKLSVSQESFGYQSLDDPIAEITPNSDNNIDLSLESSQMITNQGVTYTYDADMILMLQTNEPDCILFTRDNWNLESTSFMQINNWICGYDIDYSLLANHISHKYFELTIKKLKLTNLIISYNAKIKENLNSTNNNIAKYEVSLMAIDFLLAKSYPQLGALSISKLFTDSIRQNNIHEKLSLNCANGEMNIYMELAITFLINLLSSKLFGIVISKFTTPAKPDSDPISDLTHACNVRGIPIWNVNPTFNDDVSDAKLNDEDFSDFAENVELKSILSRQNVPQKSDSAM